MLLQIFCPDSDTARLIVPLNRLRLVTCPDGAFVRRHLGGAGTCPDVVVEVRVRLLDALWGVCIFARSSPHNGATINFTALDDQMLGGP